MLQQIKRVEKAIADFKNGKMIILMDDAERENEGDLIIPAELVTSEMMNFMIRNGSGIVCLSLTPEKLCELDLPLMVPDHENSSFRGTPFTVSIDARDNITTGVSASDRVQTILTVMQANAKPHDLVKPGHIFPLQAKNGGVMERQGHTEGAVDLARIAGYQPAAVLCEIMNPDGTMARDEQIEEFAKQHTLSILSIDDIIAYRLYNENFIAEEASTTLPLEQYGTFNMTVIKEKYTNKDHVVLSKPNLDNSKPVLVRIHSSCMTGDLFASNRCDCHKQLHFALEKISQEGGVLIYLDQEGRGIGLFNKIKAYALQEQGFDTVDANKELGLPADARHYAIAANILKNRKIQHVKLMTNNLHKIADLKRYGINHVEQEIMPDFANKFNQQYLLAKKTKLHQISNANLMTENKRIS